MPCCVPLPIPAVSTEGGRSRSVCFEKSNKKVNIIRSVSTLNRTHVLVQRWKEPQKRTWCFTRCFECVRASSFKWWHSMRIRSQSLRRALLVSLSLRRLSSTSSIFDNIASSTCWQGLLCSTRIMCDNDYVGQGLCATMIILDKDYVRQ